MRQLRGIAFFVLLSLVALPAFAKCKVNCGVPAPLAGVGLPALAAGAIGYFIYRGKQRSK